MKINAMLSRRFRVAFKRRSARRSRPRGRQEGKLRFVSLACPCCRAFVPHPNRRARRIARQRLAAQGR